MKQVVTRDALALIFALSIAILCQSWFSSLQNPWFLLVTGLAALPFPGPILRQTLIGTAILVGLVFVSAYLNGAASLVVILLWLVFSIIFYNTRPHASGLFTFYWPYLLATFIICLLPSFQVIDIYQTIINVLVGAGIGIACNVLAHQAQFAELFAAAVLPALKQLHHLMSQPYQLPAPASASGAKGEGESTPLFFQPWRNVTPTLLRNYPHWIYYVGFNPGLRAGTRQFLIQLSRAFDACVTGSYWTKKIAQEHQYHELNAALQRVNTTNLELVQILIDYFAMHKVPEAQTDWVTDLAALEALLKSYITVDMNLLEMVPEQLALVIMLHHIKDLRRALLELARALPPLTKPMYTL